MITKMFLEEELRRSCILNDNSQIEAISQLIFDLIAQGLIGSKSARDLMANQVDRVRGSSKQRSTLNKSHASKFLVRFEDSDVGDCCFDDEAEARRFFDAASLNWNCYLFAMVE
jgi:hypothetical protein